MMIVARKTLVFVLFVLGFSSQQIFAQDTLLNILKDEMLRELEVLKNQSPAPYYIEYRVDDLKTLTLGTSFGSLTTDNEDDGRVLSATIKIGNYELDNSHESEAAYGASNQPFTVRLPIENKPEALKVALWQATHYAYRNSVDAYNQAMSGMKEDKEPKKIPDFSIEKPASYIEQYKELGISNKNMWITRLKEYTEPFLNDDNILMADATLTFMGNRKYFVNSEGSTIVQNSSYVQLQVVAGIKSEDGDILPLYKSYYAFSADGLPNHNQVLADVKLMMTQLIALRKAPKAEPYTGPAILSNDAAAVFFHEIFGHRVEGHRLKSKYDSQTFKAQLGEKVLPKFINITCDPTIPKFGNQDMYGYYKFDDQGVVASKVEVVKNGVLRDFLMSRSPVDGLLHSNGHGRAQPGMAAVSRQSNLIVESSKMYSDKDLRKKLIAECKKQNKEYGYLFDEVVGGFTMTTRFSPNVFNVKPTLVYKIFVDGRPDELVRGVDFIGTPLAIFSEVEATGDSTGVFTGYCGAESGNIPVTAVSPSLFIKKIETQKQPEGYSSMPILPRPDVERLKK